MSIHHDSLVFLRSLFSVAIAFAGFGCRQSPQVGQGAESPQVTVASATPSAAPTVEANTAVKNLLSQPWLATWQEPRLIKVRQVAQKSDLSMATGLPPVWVGEVTDKGGKQGYVMWETEGEGRLVEFAFDDALSFDFPQAKAISGVPALQQFPLDEPEGKIASGCVPTAGASVAGWWMNRGFPQWKGTASGDGLRELTLRLRGRMKMTRFPDKDGFTTDGMALAGTMPDQLAKALNDEATALQLPMTAKLHRFSFSLLKDEIATERPVLVSCVVRVPHKPELSWGHELAGVGWAEIGQETFVGVIDNFFPTKNQNAVRWIRADAFHSLITLQPK